VVIAAGGTTIVAPLNWTPIIAVVLPIVGTLIAIAGYLNTKTEARSRQSQQVQDSLRAEIKSSIDNLASLLLEKLETKETVNALKVELARVKVELESIERATIARSPKTEPA
jgi:hypothetical protein